VQEVQILRVGLRKSQDLDLVATPHRAVLLSTKSRARALAKKEFMGLRIGKREREAFITTLKNRPWRFL